MALTIEQLAERQTMITATDIVSIANLSPYSDSGPHRVYASKVGTPELGASTIPMMLGNAVEPFLLNCAAQQMGVETKPGVTVRHVIDAWMGATPDAFVLAPPPKVLTSKPRPPAIVGLIQAKCVGFDMMQAHWGPLDALAVPEYVLVQCQWEMMATGVRKNTVAALFGTHFQLFEIGWNEDLADALSSIGHKFWREHVVPRIPPAPDGSKAAWAMLRKIFPRPKRGGLLWAPEPIAKLMKDTFAAGEQAKRWETEYEKKRQELASAIGENEGYEVDGLRVRWQVRAAHSRPACDVAESRALDLRAVKGKKERAA